MPAYGRTILCYYCEKRIYARRERAQYGRARSSGGGGGDGEQKAGEGTTIKPVVAFSRRGGICRYGVTHVLRAREFE